MLSTILFDADGVVLNGPRFSDTLETELHISKAKTLPFFTTTFLDCLAGKADLKITLAPLLLEWNYKGTVEEFLQFWFKSEHFIDNELLELVKQLRASTIFCFIAMNQEYYRREYIRNEMKVDTYFDGIFSSNEMGVIKPQPEYFEYILNMLDVKPESVLLVDDSKTNIEAADSLGFKTLHYTSYSELLKHLQLLKIV